MATKREPLESGLGVNVEMLVQPIPWGRGGVEALLIAHPRFPGDKRYVATNVDFEPHKEGQYQEPTFKLQHDAPQKLMDELWKAGIRPSNGEGSVGEIGAIKKHLQDMRLIVADKLKVDLK